MLIDVIDLYLYREVYIIVEWRDGAVYRTKSTGKYIDVPDEIKESC